MKHITLTILALMLSIFSASAQADFLNSLRSEDLEGRSDALILNNLHGLLPGLYISNSGTEPASAYASPAIRIRGEASFGGNNVLILVDGVQRDPSDLDANEVESVSVIKDVAALALYGVRAADGALLITTKRGGNKEFRLRASYRGGVQQAYGMPTMASGVQYANSINEARINDGLAPLYTPNTIESIGDVVPCVDWQKEMIRPLGSVHDAYITVDGSKGKARYFVYADYSSNHGFFANTDITPGMSTQLDYNALKLRTNLDVQMTESTLLIINLAARIQQQNSPYHGNSLSGMYKTPAIAFPIQEEGKWVQSQIFTNPVLRTLGSGYQSQFSRMLSADLTIRQRLAEGLNAEARISYDNNAFTYDSKNFGSAYLIPIEKRNPQGDILYYDYLPYGNDTEISFGTGLKSQYMHTALWGKLDYTRSIDKHNFELAAIFRREQIIYSGANNTFTHHDAIFAASYNFAGKYFANISATGSASNKLIKGHKYRFYPAASLSWLISEEDFLKGQRSIDHLNLRASAGLLGMDANLAFDMDKQFNGSGKSYLFASGVNPLGGGAEGALPSTGIEPELQMTSNIGIELGLFGALRFQAEAFYNQRSNIRTSSNSVTSAVLGIGQSDVFTGKVSNYGVDFALAWKQQKGNLGYYLRGNVSLVRNRIDSINEEFQPESYLYRQGHSIGAYYGLVADGFYSAEDIANLSSLPVNSFSAVQEGDVKYRDLNGDNVINDYDYKYYDNSSLPQIYYGLQMGAELSGVGFNAYFYGAGDFYVKTTQSSIYQPLYGGDKNISTYYLENYYGSKGANARYPRLTTLDNNNNFRPSNIWIEKGDYFKLKELELYYKFPQSLMRSWNMEQVKVFLRGSNLFSIDHIKIFDPEYISTGYPMARVYSIGFNLTF